MTQETVFQSSEGNRYYSRNRAALRAWNPSVDMPLQLLELYGIKPTRALEIGAANGVRLAEINRRYGAEVIAVEPSLDAITEGRHLYPSVEFHEGVASDLRVQGAFDLVIVHFVLSWVDRSSILKVVAEIDRFTADGGYLLIGDFAPATLLKTPYHHLPDQEMFTFKQNYSEPFISSGLYHAVAMLTGNHAGHGPNAGIGEAERISVWLLQKRTTDHYALIRD
jgi:SAM-dependent methyltransferase